MKKTTLLITVLIFAFSCNETSKEEKEELLSSITWTIAPDEKGNQSTFQFLANGTYIMKAMEIEVNGQWSWVSKDEIYLELKGLTFDNEATKFDHKSNNYYIKVLELSNNVFKTLERHENDDWDSGSAKEIRYIPKGL